MWQPRLKNECVQWKSVVSIVFRVVLNTSCCGGSSSPPLLSSSPWERCTFPGRHSYVLTEGRDGTWVGNHQRNNMCARHRAGSRVLWSKPQKAKNYRCLSFSITQSLNTSRGTAEPSHPPLQLGGNSLLSNNLWLGNYPWVQSHLKQLGSHPGSCNVTARGGDDYFLTAWLLYFLRKIILLC